ncbi:MAG: glycoside hydrolase [Leptolyngbya sp.]|nr:MAG: glycoside hydrolase [Leptolyngbya sp.]
MTSFFTQPSSSSSSLVPAPQLESSDNHDISEEAIATDKTTDALQVARGVYITIHGHFYQPPRENPYLDVIERQPSAAPFHNWNERIHHECYRPNAFARIVNDRDEIVGIVNNYEYLSFNFGATLLNWMERHDVEVYQRILEADRKSCDRLNGHGNAIAQVYNHIILPLANERDKLTQIRWGKADFRSRFGRDPKGMWLAETAVDYVTLEALVSEGIQFIILAPSQAQRCRPIFTPDQPEPEWQEVGGGQINPTRPYRCYLPSLDQNSPPPSIDIFFYDGPISRDMGFDQALSNSHQFAGRLGQAVQGDQRSSQLIAAATDGETFGHHKGGTEKCLAYAFVHEFPNRGWTVTNFAHYLSICAPAWEVELKPVTAWSCSHGVDRWQADCGCGSGGGWHQQWRRPLRDSLDWLRDQLGRVYEDAGSKLLHDPWKARDEYIEVVRDRSQSTVKAFLGHHQSHSLTAAERVDVLRLLEMQRHALLMYTSCGWFFEELSRPEGVQILRYAARALELAGDVTGIHLEKALIKRLATVPSNVDCFKNGAEVYRQLVTTAQISLEQVAAHYAISSLFTAAPKEQRVYCYTAQQVDYQLQRMGSLTLAVGQLQLTSEITRESVDLVFAVLHLGGWDFHCCIQPFSGRRNYSQMKEGVFTALGEASSAKVILAMHRSFGDQSFSLQNLFAEERHRIMQMLTQSTLTRLDQLYTQVYRDNYGILMAFHRDGLTVPRELQVAAEVALSHRVLLSLRLLEQELSDPLVEGTVGLGHLAELEAIAAEATQMQCPVKLPEARQILERLILQSLRNLLQAFNPATLTADLERIQRFMGLGQQFNLNLSLAQAQEFYMRSLHQWIVPQCIAWIAASQDLDKAAAYGKKSEIRLAHLRSLLRLGQLLAINVTSWLEQLP